MAGIYWLAALALCEDPTPAPQAPYLDLAVELEDAGKKLAGRASFELAKGTYEFLLDSTLTVRAVTLDGSPLASSPESLEAHGVTQWTFALNHAGRLNIEYAGELAALDLSIDHRQVMQADRAMSNPDWAWLPASSYWHPMPVQGLAGYTVDIRPHQGVAVTAGAYQDLGDGRMRFRFDSIVAGIDVLIGPYQRTQRRLEVESGNPVELATYFTPATQDLSDTYLTAASDHIRNYSESIAPYPFASFTMVASPLPSGFGMPGLTWLGETILRLPFIPSTSLRHEVLHNWWGNGVRVDYQQGNWSEGLTTLMADFAAKLEQDPQAGERQRMAWVRDWVAIPANERTALREFRSRTHGRLAAVGYSRAAFLLWMLAQEVGEPTWQAGLKHFWLDCRDQAAGWHDLRTAMARTSNGPVWRHFDTWLESNDLPKLELLGIDALNAERTTVNVRIRQTGPDVELRVPVFLKTEHAVERHVIDLNSASHAQVLLAKAPVLSVALDPRLEILREPLAGELPPVLRNFSLAADAVIVVATPGEQWQKTAEQLSAQFFERPAKILSPTQLETLASTPGAWLVVGSLADARAFLRAQNLGPAEPDIGTEELPVTVWSLPVSEPRLVAVIAATRAEELQPLIRRLTHYGGESYLGFRAGELIQRGVWPLNPQQLPLPSAPQQ